MKKLLIIAAVLLVAGCSKEPQGIRSQWTNDTNTAVMVFTDHGTSFDLAPGQTTNEGPEIYGARYEVYYNDPSQFASPDAAYVCCGVVNRINIIKFTER